MPKKLLDKLCRVLVKVLPKTKNKAVSLAIISAPAIKKLNKQYRHKDKVTDVLSFENLDSKKTGELGEILICLSQVKKQAKEFGKTFDREFSLLVIHGILHLMGFEHQNDSAAERMQQLEQKILSKIF